MAHEASDWVFLTIHGTVLLTLAADPTMDIGQIAQVVGATEPAARQIVDDLVAEGYVTGTRDGPRIRYEINREAHLRHPLFQGVEIGPLIDALRMQGTP
jgi:hypothetical protein